MVLLFYTISEVYTIFGMVSHKNAIIATITNGISNARIEATNNKIKLSVRMAYGFRNIDNLISMIMLRCGGLNIGLPGRAQRI